MLSRRRFLFLLGGATTGLWLASTGLVRLERSFLLSLAGSCSFCGKDRTDVHALVGTAGHATRICDECVGLCCDIIAEEMDLESPRGSPLTEPASFDDEKLLEHVSEMLRSPGDERAASRSDRLLNELRRSLDPVRPASTDMFRCSFCDARRSDVRKLISGPRVFICDTCVAEATAVVSHVLRSA